MTAGGADRFGRYELLATLGQGGFAVVYRAFDPALQREVAIKALLPHLAADADVRQRFVAEAQALAALQHPNIVTVYDVGEAEGRPFFAMELIDGRSLADALGEGTLSVEPVATILRSLASAVDYLHAAGLVHRDIKPANVMLDHAGRAVLMDFGVARIVDRSLHTQTGASLGTPTCMSPEQVRGLAVGPAADIYMLGILAYQLLAGHPPFEGDTAYVLHAQVYEPPPPLSLRCPGLPQSVYNAIDAALAKDPADRPASATTFAEALSGVTVLPPVRRRRTTLLLHNRVVLGAAGAALAIFAIAVAAILVAEGGHHGGGEPSTAALTKLATSVTVTPTVAAAPPVVVPTVATPPPTQPASPPSPTVMPPIPPPETPTIVPATTSPSPAPRFHAGQLVRVNTPNDCLLLRTGPSTAQSALDCRGDGDTLRVVAGPVPDGDQRFWRVAPWKAGDDAAGWVRQDYLADSPDCDRNRDDRDCPVNRLTRGEIVRVKSPGDCLLLRNQPDAAQTTGVACLPDGRNLRVLEGPAQSGGIALWKVTGWSAADGTGGWAREDALVLSPDCNNNRNQGVCGPGDLPPQPTPSPSPRPATPQPQQQNTGIPQVAGDWNFTDYVWFGVNSKQHYSFPLHLSQQGTHVTGSNSDFSVDGQLSGTTLRASYSGSGSGGQFIWTFTSDGTRFEGAFTNSAGNGGTSYGHRSSGAVSSADLATVSIVGADVTGGRVRTDGNAWVCVTVSRPAHLTITSTVTGGFSQEWSDDGTGSCIGVNTAADVSGPRTFRVQMVVGGQTVAQSQITVMIGG